MLLDYTEVLIWQAPKGRDFKSEGSETETANLHALAPVLIGWIEDTTKRVLVADYGNHDEMRGRCGTLKIHFDSSKTAGKNEPNW